MEVREADGEFTLLLQHGALMDESGVDFVVVSGLKGLAVSHFIQNIIGWLHIKFDLLLFGGCHVEGRCFY